MKYLSYAIMGVALLYLGLTAVLASSSLSVSRAIYGNSSNSYRRRPNDDKIVGGQYVEDMANFSFMVSVHFNHTHDCGGSLLSVTFVLTACHCVAFVPDFGIARPFKARAEMWKFVAGSKTLEPLEKSAQVRTAKALHYHTKCGNFVDIVYDMGLGITDKPFIRTEFVTPIKMFSWDPTELANKFQSISEGKENPVCFVAGWGETRRGDVEEPMASNILKYVRMFLQPDKFCCKAYHKILNDDRYNNFSFARLGQVCSLSEKTDSSDCQGDSGGPYFCGDRIVAVVIYGVSCGTDEPTVYQTVSILPDWLRKDFPGQLDMSEPNTREPGTPGKPSTMEPISEKPIMTLTPETTPKTTQDAPPMTGHPTKGAHPIGPNAASGLPKNLVLIIVTFVVGYALANR